ncbi:MAG TPA: c-type cytochrome [Acetobacteraceae bacterium]|nr:c-type cytochrome [Acetobacteraceae bacterium]
MARRALETAAAMVCAALAIGAVAYVGKQGSDTTRRRVDTAAALTGGGDPARGAAHVARLGCGACHEIPGILGAHGRVGPSLEAVGARVFLAGVVPNTPANLMHWIRAPRELSPHTAMPNLGLDDAAARDIAAFLYAGSG